MLNEMKILVLIGTGWSTAVVSAGRLITDTWTHLDILFRSCSSDRNNNYGLWASSLIRRLLNVTSQLMLTLLAKDDTPTHDNPKRHIKSHERRILDRQAAILSDTRICRAAPASYPGATL